MELFFERRWAPFIYKFRWLVVVLLTGFIGYSGYTSSQVKPLSSKEKYFKDDHPFEIVQALLISVFNQGINGGSTIPVKLIWGVKGVDLSQAN